ncbi:P-loop containing nucleoside triphosphate hydrolase protein [Durotheca rogersii]|uniref:P-loop containing nucleoside triphosphate hydrolase protein n=1 Tax=Durotheca rogersii TaxID=419775 RepID=UPI00221FCFAA|nr:P-loop containing nucleoside triphosphate hydrolase protein [Durotheca rogersii]KAI5868622.1 P-loop containing nucleoside triphosphate hydrolase protein [Durotheca rogersii]
MFLQANRCGGCLINPSAAASSAAHSSGLISTAAGTSMGRSAAWCGAAGRYPPRVSRWARSASASSTRYWRTSMEDLLESTLPATMRAAIPGVSSRPSRASAVKKNLFSATDQVTAPICVSLSTPLAPGQIRLRDYQEECIQSVLNSLQGGHKRLGISLATGSGKTVIFTQLIERIQPGPEGARQTLILAHRRELVEQAARHCTLAYPGKSVEIEMGNMHASGFADITIASVQSITSGDRIGKFDYRRFKLVLVDEAHHIVAPGYLRTLEHFKLHQKTEESPILVGVSATFSRFDGLQLGAAIDEIVYHKDYVDMIGEKWLSDVIFTTVDSTANMMNVRKNAHGDFHVSDLSNVVNTEEVNEITVRSWLARAAARKSTLVFCVDLNHVVGLTQTFRRHGVDARFITGETPKLERSERLDAFKRYEFPVLVNCSVFTEGTDIPNIDCVVLGRPTRSRNLLVQMIGRGMRLHPNKTNCHVIDMVSSLATGIVTTPTLFGLNPSEVVQEATITDMQEIKERQEAEVERQALVAAPSPDPEGQSKSHRVTFIEYDSVFDLIADTSGEMHIRKISQYAWVQVGEERYILSGPRGSYVRLEKAENGSNFEAFEIRALPGRGKGSQYARPRKILEAPNLTSAIHGSDSFVSGRYPYYFIAWKQKWRGGEPTEGQLEMLNKYRDDDKQLTKDDVTKGKAMDMITKIKHGARGRFATLGIERRKQEKLLAAQEQEKSLHLREKVTVGPLAA